MDPLLCVDTDTPLSQVAAAFEHACKRHEFGVLGQHDLRAKMREKGVRFQENCLVFEVCNPKKAKQVLDRDLAISTALPCRVSLYRVGEKTRLATIRPTVLLTMFGVPDLEGVAKEIEETLLTIMTDLAQP